MVTKKKAVHKAPAVKPEPKTPKQLYSVTINGGNDPGVTISSLDELAGLAEKKLVTDEERAVQLRITPIMVKTEFASARADGVPVK